MSTGKQPSVSGQSISGKKRVWVEFQEDTAVAEVAAVVAAPCFQFEVTVCVGRSGCGYGRIPLSEEVRVAAAAATQHTQA